MMKKAKTHTHFYPGQLNRITDIKLKLHPEILKFPWKRGSKRSKAAASASAASNPNASLTNSHSFAFLLDYFDQLQNN